MAETMGHTASATRNTNVALGIFVLALAPQIFEFLWSWGMLFGLGTGRGPLQSLISHGSALLAGAPGAAFEAKALGSEVTLALIYSYPMFAAAVLTLFVKIRSPQDYIGGAVLVALALFSLWASSDLQGMRGFSFGAGTAPRMFGVLMLALGLGVMVMGLVIEGPHLAKYHWRGPLFVSLSIVAFAVMIRPMGLIVTAFAAFLISALGTHETKWKETIIVGACLTAFCSVLFPYALGLPLQMWPKFMIQ